MDTEKGAWHLIADAPFDKDLELAVIEGAEKHVLVVRCRRDPYGWTNAVTGQRMEVNPTHWRE